MTCRRWLGYRPRIPGTHSEWGFHSYRAVQKPAHQNLMAASWQAGVFTGGIRWKSPLQKLGALHTQFSRGEPLVIQSASLRVSTSRGSPNEATSLQLLFQTEPSWVGSNFTRAHTHTRKGKDNLNAGFAFCLPCLGTREHLDEGAFALWGSMCFPEAGHTQDTRHKVARIYIDFGVPFGLRSRGETTPKSSVACAASFSKDYMLNWRGITMQGFCE